MEDLVSGVRILGNPVAGFRAEGLWEGANFVNFLEECDRVDGVWPGRCTGIG